MIMMTPAAATTQRLLTPVSRTRPTFSENAVYGNELKMPPMTVARPSARSTLPMSEALMRLPTISPVAMVRPVDSTAVMSSMMIIVRQATMSNLGMPNRNGWVKPIGAACADLVEVHVAQREGDRAADDQAEQHRDGGQEAAEEALDRDDDRDGAQRVEQPPDVGGVVLVRVRIGDGVAGADRHQTQPDDGDQGAGDHRREEPQQLDEDRGDQEREDAGDDHRAVDVEQAGCAAAVGQADRDDRGDAREGHALQQRQPDARSSRTRRPG